MLGLYIFAILIISISSLSNVTPKLRYFINLTNGIEAMPSLLEKGINLSDMQFIRIQSSHCEAADHEAIIDNLDYNFLMSLALGNVNVVYDFGSRGTGMPNDPRDGIPRALWWGTEFVRHALEYYWDLPGRHHPTRMVKGCNVKLDFDQRCQNLPKSTRKRLKYFRNFVTTDKILWYNVYDKTEHDGDKAYYSDTLRSLHGVTASTDEIYIDRGITAGVGSDEALDNLVLNECVPKGMHIYRSSDFLGFGRAEGMNGNSNTNTQTPVDPWTSI